MDKHDDSKSGGNEIILFHITALVGIEVDIERVTFL